MFCFQKYSTVFIATSLLSISASAGVLNMPLAAHSIPDSKLTADQQKYFKISKVTTEIIPIQAPTKKVSISFANPVVNGLQEVEDTVDKAEIVFDKIVNLGRKVWDVVQQGKAVAEVSTDVATALPEGAEGWTNFSNWQKPKAYLIRRRWVNGFNAEVAVFEFKVIYVYGGSLDGRGRYIAYASVRPSTVDVHWGFNLKSTAKTALVYNIGTSSEPIGALHLQVDTEFGAFLDPVNPLSKIQRESMTFYVDGQGRFRSI